MNYKDGSTAAGAESLVDLLRWRAANQPDRIGYTFITGAGADEAALTYAELDRRARAVAAQLQQIGAAGSRALLLYPPGLDYICAFMGCLYAGVIAVPAYPPNPARLARSLSRLRAVVQSARPTVALTTAAVREAAEGLMAADPDFAGVRWVTAGAAADAWQRPPIAGGTLAFLQYTSGSTSAPKGVMLTHANLLHNLGVIERCFEHTPDSHAVIWLPPYHDMGLIGGILQPLYTGYPVTLLSPADFLQRPLLWLQTISRTRATTSGGPNFAYDLCVQKTTPEQRAALDLSCWDLAFNGAEPVRPATLERFAAAFAPSGFRREAFYPCYGLAEATLLVSGGAKSRPPVVQSVDAAALEQHRATPAAGAAARELAGSGPVPPEHALLTVHPERLTRCAPGEVGEIWVGGPSVAQGYWEQPAETERTFQARLADTGEGPFLRTGDLGFLHDGQLFVTGRLKDLIIIRGRNYYPQDIEQTVEQSHPALRPGCCAAFTVEEAGEERLVVVQELDRQHRGQDVAPVLDAVRRAVAEQHELNLHAVVLLRHGSALKTSSGKIQRRATRSAFLEGRLEAVGQHVLQPEQAPAGPAAPSQPGQPPSVEPARLSQPELERLLVGIWQRTLGLERISVHDNFFELGVDSVSAVRVAEQLKATLGVDISAVSLYEQLNIRALAQAIAQERQTAPAQESQGRRRQYRQVKRSERLVEEQV